MDEGAAARPLDSEVEIRSRSDRDQTEMTTGCEASKVNGVYEPVPEQLHNGRAVYTKAGSPELCLYCTPDDQWAVSRAKDMDTNNNAGYAFSAGSGLAFPQDGKSWKINDELQPSMLVVTLTAQVRV